MPSRPHTVPDRPPARSSRRRAALAIPALAALACGAAAMEPGPRTGALSLSPGEIHLGRTYRGSRRSFTVRAAAPPSATLDVGVTVPTAPDGTSAAGVAVRAAEDRVTTGEDGTAEVLFEVAVDAAAPPGPAAAGVVVSLGGRTATATVSFEVVRARLVAPERLDLGTAYVRGSARAELALTIEARSTVSLWLDWGGLTGEFGEILPAFVSPAFRSADMRPEEELRVPVEVNAPAGIPPGRYSGRMDVTAGPYRAAVALSVEVSAPVIEVTPSEIDLGVASGGARAAGEFTVTLTGAAPERVEIDLAGPPAKLTRPEALLAALAVEKAADVGEVRPGESVAARLAGEIPTGQEDGEYAGEIVVRAGVARARIPVRVKVARAEGLEPFEVEPLELLVPSPRGEETTAAVRVTSNEDSPLELTARLEPPARAGWQLALQDDLGDLAPDEARTITLMPRQSVDLVLAARVPDGARLNDRAEARLVVEGAGATGRVDVVVEAAPTPVRTDVARSSATPRLALALVALALAAAAAAAWRVRPVRYGAISASAHALLLVAGIGSPLLAPLVRAAGAERAVAIRVIDLEDPFGTEDLAAAGRSRPEQAQAPDTAPTRAAPAAAAGAAPAAGSEEAAGELASDLWGEDAWPPPSHPDAVARRGAEPARAPAPAAGPPAERISDGFDLDGPVARLCVLEQGTIERACVSGGDLFGALAAQANPGAMENRSARLVEAIPSVAPAPSADRAARQVASAPGTRPAPALRPVAGPARVTVKLDAPAPRAAGVGTAMPALAPAVAAGIPASAVVPGRIELDEAVPNASRLAAIPPERRQRAEEAADVTGRPRPRVEPSVLERRAGPPEAAPEPSAPASAPPLAQEIELARADLPLPVLPLAGTSEDDRPGLMEKPESPSARTARDEGAGPRPLGPEPGRPGVPGFGDRLVTSARGLLPAALPSEAVGGPSFAGRPSAPTPLGASQIERALLAPAPDVLPQVGRSVEVTGRRRATRVRVLIGVLKHSGGWTESSRAMITLSHELPLRQPGFSMQVRVMPLRATEDILDDCAFVYVTGTRDPALTEPECAALRGYLDRGGFLWIDDGAPPGDNTFDRAARGFFAKLAPGSMLRRVPFSHAVFTAAYDLTRGYLGRSTPAGAWMRKGELEGIFGGTGRLLAVYTRNGYGLAMRFDPNGEPDFVPPPGVTPREAREGALRLAVNLAVHVLQSGGQPVASGGAREELDPSLRYRYRGGPLAVERNVWVPESWRMLPTSSPVRLSGTEEELRLDLQPGAEPWAGVIRMCPEGVASARAMVFDLDSALPSAARLAVRIRTAGGELYESVPLHLRPGANADLRVPLDAAEFRATTTGWRDFDAELDRRKGLSTVAFVIYGRDLTGSVALRRFRLEGWSTGTR